jgi:hypothetical protein
MQDTTRVSVQFALPSVLRNTPPYPHSTPEVAANRFVGLCGSTAKATIESAGYDNVIPTLAACQSDPASELLNSP